MGGSIFMLFGTNVQQGLNCAQETFISQSYGASQDKTRSEAYKQSMRHNCGVYYNRGRIVSTLAVIPIAFIFAYTERFLLACSQDAFVAHIACNYVFYMIPGAWFFGQFDCSMKFLGAQYINKIPIYT